MRGLGLDHPDAAAAPVEDGDAEPGAGADHAGDAVGGRCAGAAERDQLVRAHHRDRVSDRAEIVEQGEPFEAERGGDPERGRSASRSS